MTLSKNLCAEGKTVAVYENGYITIKKGEWKIRQSRSTNIRRKAKFMIANVLATLQVIYGDLKPKILAYRYKLSFQVQHKLLTYEYI
jgi:hypothetical protein